MLKPRHVLAVLIVFLVLLMACLPGARAQTVDESGTTLLLSNTSATGPAMGWRGGIGVFAAAGTFGGGTVTLQFLGPDGVTWIAAGTNTTCTAACGGVFYLPAGSIRALVSGGAPSGLYASVNKIQQVTVP